MESLERRDLLAGDFTNSLIDETSMNRILDGLDGTALWTSELGQSEPFTAPLAMLTESDGSRLSVSDFADLGGSFEAALATPLRSHIESLAAGDRDTDALVQFLSSQPGVVSVEGGLTASSIDELRFDVQFQDSFTAANLGVDLGANASEMDLSLQTELQAQATAAVTFNFVFGLQLAPNLSDEMAFFLRDSAIQIETDLYTTSESAAMELGFLAASAEIREANLDLDFQVTLTDLSPDIDRNITLADLNGFTVSQLVDVDISANSTSATITSNPSLGDWAILPSLTVSGQANDVDVTLSPNDGFADLANLANVDSQTLSTTFTALVDAFRILGDTRSFQVDLPFLDGAPTVFDLGSVLEDFVTPAFDADSNLVSENVTELATALGIAIRYDSATDELVLPLAMEAAMQSTVVDVNVEESVGPISNIQVTGSSATAATGTFEFELRIDLTESTAPIAERVSIHGVNADINVAYDAMDISGSIEYGIVGLDFIGGSLSGDINYSAELLDEISLEQLELLLDASSYLLAAPITRTGTANLELGDLTVASNLFPVDDVNLTLEFDDDGSVPKLNATGNSILDSLSRIDVGMIVSTLTDAVTQTLDAANYVDAWNEQVGVIPVVGDVISIIDPNVFSKADDSEALLLHEIPAAIENVPELLDVGAIVGVVVDTTKSTVKFSLNLAKSATNTLQFGLDFGAGLGDAIGDVLYDAGEFAGDGGSIITDLNAELEVGLLLDASQEVVTAHLLDSSGVTAELYVSQGVDFDGSLGVLGAEFTGALVIAADSSDPDATAPATITSKLKTQSDGRYPLDGMTEIELESSATGQLSVDYEFFSSSLPSQSHRFSFEIDDLDDSISSLTVNESPDFAGLMQNVNVGDDLSAVPDALLDILNAIIDATNDDSGVFGVGFPVIGKLLAGEGNFLQDIYDKLAAQFDNLTDFEPARFEDFLETAIANAFGIQNRDVFGIDTSNLDDIRMTLDLSGTVLDVSKDFNTDLGFSALGASLNTKFEIIGSYDAVLTFGLNSDPNIGVYLDTGNEDLSLDLAVNLAGEQGVPDFEGWLGFVSVDVENVGSDTIFHGQYTIDLTEPSGDQRLTIEEALDAIGTSLVDHEKSGLTAGTGEKAGDKIILDISVEAADWAPSLYATLEISWQFDGFSSNISRPTVEYSDVGIDLGDLIANNFCPLITTVSRVLDPLDGVVDVFQTEVPYVSDALGPTTILDMAAASQTATTLFPGEFFERLEKNLKTMNTFVRVLTVIDQLGDVCTNSHQARLNIGSLSFDGLETDLQEIGTEWLEENLDIDPGRIADQLQAEAADLIEATENVKFSGGKIEFPIWENPLSAFEWLLGIRHVPIVTMEVADLTVDLELPLAFPLGPITAGLKGGLLIEAGISVGLDTLGFSDYFASGDPVDLFNGFYISDTENADGSGDDIPEVSVTGSLTLFAKTGVDGLLTAEVEGGLYADIKLDLLDHYGEDGRIRGNELIHEDGCLRIDGGVYIEASVEAEAFGVFEADLPIGKPFDIASFDRTYYCKNTEARLADLNPIDGTLTLLVGARASSRDIYSDVTDEDYTVSITGDQLVISAFGASQSFNTDLVTKIVADAGSGDDIIQITPSVTINADIKGGDGHDRLIGGGGDDTIDGGDDNDDIDGGGGIDIITTGSGEDIVNGGPGDDTITGSEDVDILDGGEDNDTINGAGGNDILFGSSGNDTINGGPGEDRISGGSGDDMLNGGEQNDEVFGDGGQDEIDGDEGDDYLNGGSDADTISDDMGVTVAYGGSGDDTIEGGPLADELHGGKDNDTIRGADGEDLIFGDNGNDTIEGGNHADTIDGGGGNDDIHGNQGNDLLLGGDDDDTINGDNGEDEIHGGPGNDPELSGGPGNDIIRGGSGADGIFGQGGEDELFGDSGDDDIHGGPQNDFIDGMTGGDHLHGDDGEDQIFGSSGNDQIEGGADDDWIEGGSGHDEIWGDGGEDQVFGDSGNDSIHGGSENDTLRGMTGNDIIYGDDGDDEIFADSGNDYVEGNTGRDYIDGGSGNDELHGNENEDTMYGGAGNDKMYGEQANDLMYGNDDNDQMFGGPGRDEMHGDQGKDLMFGESGPDQMFGGLHNDTMRGGPDDDVMRGNEGDDLMLGNGGNDEISGDEDNDVLLGNDGADILSGGPGNDRGMGGDGDDIIEGDGGNDILDGEAGDDQVFGNDGRDELMGGPGIDMLNGGENDDYLLAGDGIGNELRGGPGNDVLVGSDYGSDDPNLNDTVYFGDILFGDAGNDQISGLGGADIIDAGVGNDIVRGGTHGDLIIGGPSTTTDPDQDTLAGDQGDDLIRGGADLDRLRGGDGTDTLNGGAANNQISQNGTAPDPTDELSDSSSPGDSLIGNWKSIAGSASTDGLTQVGGFEHAIFTKGDRVYATWVDTRNGNTEIYAAYHTEGQPEWISLNGPGGVSNDEQQSRRPSIVATDNQVLVSWTSIDEMGNETVKVAVGGTAPGGGAAWPVAGSFAGDHSQLAAYPHGAMLARIDDLGSVTTEQYWACPGVSPSSGWVVGGGIASPILGAAGLGVPRLEIDLATTEGAAGIAATYELNGQTYLETYLAGPTISFPETCPDPNGPGVITIMVPRTGRWDPTPAITAENLSSPAIAIGNLVQSVSGPNDTPQTQHQVDVHVAWDFESDYENQVDGAVGTKHFAFGTLAAEPFEWNASSASYNGTTANTDSDTISDTIGYAAKPSLSASQFGAFLAWMDDSVHQQQGDARSSIYVTSAGLGSSTYTEELPGNASGSGISSNGGALQSLSISVDPSEVDVAAGDELHRPYVGWTDAITGQQQVYLRRDLNKSVPGVEVTESSGKTLVSEDGQSDTYTVALTAQPIADVTIKIETDHQLQATPTKLTFTPGDWSTPQTITVVGIDNRAIEGNRISEIDHQASSTDLEYENIPIPSLIVRIKDNDFNDDGILDSQDIDALFARAGQADGSRDDLRFDVDDDNQLTSRDVDSFVSNTFDTTYGDSDLDGDVDFSDFLDLAANFGRENKRWKDGDTNGDGEVNFVDFLRFSENFGRRVG